MDRNCNTTETEIITDTVTLEQFRKLFPDASESTIAANRRLGGLLCAECEPDRGGALVGKAPPKQASRGRMASGGPVLRITLVAHRRRLITDSDNLPKGFKGLRDTIARFFDLDDADNTIVWQYGQVQTSGRQGTTVTVEQIPKNE